MDTALTTNDERDAGVPNATVPNLPVRAARGGTAMLLSQGCKFVLLFAAQIILARLLTPEDFGLFAIVTSITAFFSLFSDLGLPMATIQRHEISHEQVSLLFWINTFWGGTLAILTAVTAGLFSAIYGEPRIASMMMVLSTGFLFIGLGSQHRALLKRGMRFTSVGIIELLSVVIGVSAGIGLARIGFHYWALVYMRLATLAFTTLALLFASGWRPSRPKLTPKVRPLLTFGVHLTGFDVMGYVTRYADNLLIGWYSGPRALGFYYKAYQMLLVPTQNFSAPLGGVMIPVLSRLQMEPRRFGAYYHRGVLLSAATGMPLVAFLFIGADWIVPLLLGGQWADSVPLFRALALAAFIGPADVGSGWLIVSTGRTGRQFKWSLMTTVLMLAGFILGIRWGAFGVALSFSICRALLIIPKLIYTCKGSPVRWVEVVQTISRPAVAALLSAAALSALTRQLSFAANSFADLAACGFIFGLMYAGIWLMLPGGRRTLRSLVELFRYIR